MRTLNQERLTPMAEYIDTYQKEKGRSLSYREIMHHMSMSSLNLVQRYVLGLVREGKITMTRLGNIELPAKLDTGEIEIVPLVRQIPCCEPC